MTDFLVDTGADVSVFPASSSDTSPAGSLVAANGSSIQTFGTRRLPIHFQGLKTDQLFHVASVKRPILGADFFADHDLLIDLRGRRLLRLPRKGSSFLSPLPPVQAQAAPVSLPEICGLHCPRANAVDAVSYTHLTLPTIYSV